jgi:predicted DNA-binding transcriptional regulator AlpA
VSSAPVTPLPRMNAPQNEDRRDQASSDRLLSIDDIARWFGVSRAWVYDHTTRKRPLLPCIGFGEMTRFRRSDVEDFIRSHAKHHDCR